MEATKTVLILGGAGMLGHKLWQLLTDRFDAHVTFRQSFKPDSRYGIFDAARARTNVSTQDFDSVVRAVAAVKPSVVVNCIGIVKQDAAAKDPLTSISVNALFPHRLAQLCHATNSRLIHISTDCVFSGRKGNYDERDVPDAEDLYGRSKLLGEVVNGDGLTLRTSIIGRELDGSHGLLEWFLSQEGKTVRGYKRAIFTGFTTKTLAEIIAWIIAEHPDLRGLWHVASDPISKFDLLTLVKQVYGLNVQIEPDEEFECDRSLNGGKFRQATGFKPPTWPEMIEQMRRDTTSYTELRRIDVNR